MGLFGLKLPKQAEDIAGGVGNFLGNIGSDIGAGAHVIGSSAPVQAAGNFAQQHFVQPIEQAANPVVNGPVGYGFRSASDLVGLAQARLANNQPMMQNLQQTFGRDFANIGNSAINNAQWAVNAASNPRSPEFQQLIQNMAMGTEAGLAAVPEEGAGRALIHSSGRPFDPQQTAFEQAFAKNDLGAAQAAVNSIPDPAMRAPLQDLIDRKQPPTQVEKIAAATPVARKLGAPDAQIKQILEQGVGSNRPAALRVLEQNQANLSPADRLALTGGDTGQAGLQLAPTDRNALLAKFRQAANAVSEANQRAGEGGYIRIRGEEPAPKQSRVPSSQSSTNLNKGAFTPEDLKYLSKLSDEEKANLSSKQQMALADLENKQQPLAPQAANTAKNPYKAAIPEVKPGEYAQVIANEQAAAAPTKFAGDRWIAAMQQLKKANPAEYGNFWRYFQDKGFKDAAKSPELQAALKSWRTVDDRIHGTSQVLGGNTNYLKNHGLHPWQLPEEYTKHITNGGDPAKFPGLNNISRKYQTVAEGEANGLKIGSDPLKEGSNYIDANSALLRRRAIVKGVQEADAGEEAKTHNLDLGPGHTVPVSTKAMSALRGLQRAPASSNAIIKGARTLNTGIKSSILSLGQFHPINISLLRAAPTLAAEAHPLAALKGAYGTFRALAPGGKAFVERTLTKALTDTVKDPGTGKPISYVDAGAKIGMPYGTEGFDAEGSFLKGGIGHKMVFQRQMPMMHDQVVRSVVSDLISKKIPLDSAKARAAGAAGNRLMGFVNAEAEKIPPRVNRGLGDFLLAKQFTTSKLLQTKAALTEGGISGSYARMNIAANVAAAGALITGLGYLFHQKSDDLRDMLLRALVDPAIPTPFKDEKGNSVKIRLPGTDTSDIAKLLGITLQRGADGHLAVHWEPNDANPMNLNAPMYDWMRARLAPWDSSIVKVATNSTYAQKPLYDPSAPLGTKVAQAGTSIATGLLPIGLQGAAYTGPVKNAMPQDIQNVLNAQTPGSNPLLKSLGSSFGFTPTTDTTTGKALDASRYFTAKDDAAQTLTTQQARDAFDLYTGSKKNPVTNQYDVQPTVWDTIAKAAALNQNPQALDALIKMNQQVATQGGTVDPLWQESPDHIKAYFHYQAISDPFSPQRTAWLTQNKSWYQPLSDARAQFFSSLPPGDPNKPQQPIEYPQESPQVAQLQSQYFQITDPKASFQFLQAHPELQNAFDQQFQYKNALLQARGYSPYKDYPKATPQLQNYINTYLGASKQQRSMIRSANPLAYQAMVSYFDATDLAKIGKQASLSQLQGQPDYTSSEVKAISSLANDIYQNPDGTYQIVPAGWMSGLSNGGGSSGHSYSSSASRSKGYINPYTTNKKIYLSYPKMVKGVHAGRVRVASAKRTNSGANNGSIRVSTRKIRLA